MDAAWVNENRSWHTEVIGDIACVIDEVVKKTREAYVI